MSFRGNRPPVPFRGGYPQGDSRGGYRGRGSYHRPGYSPGNRQAPGPPDPPDRQDSSDSLSGSPYKRAPGPPDPPKRNQYGEPLDEPKPPPDTSTGGGGGGYEPRGGYRPRGYRPYYPRGRGYQQYSEEGNHEGSSYDRGRGRGYYYRGRGRGNYEEQGGPEGGGEGENRGRGYYRGGWRGRGRGDYHQGYQGHQDGGYRGRGYYRGYHDRGRGYYAGRGRGYVTEENYPPEPPPPQGIDDKNPVPVPPVPVKRPRSPSLSEDSDENIPKAYRLRRRSVSSSPIRASSSPDAPMKKASVVRRSFSRSPARDSSPDGSPQRFIRTNVERSGSGEGTPKPPSYSEPSKEFEVQPPQGTEVPQFFVVRGRGVFRARGRPPFWRGRGGGAPPTGPPPDYYQPQGEESASGEGMEHQRGGFRGRPRGWVSRGRGWMPRGYRGRWIDRGRGWFHRGRGWYPRNRGWVDRGRGGWVDRGRGWVDRGRGWVDRGRGWVDRGRGWVDRGRGWVDRGRGWVDRGRGGWVDRGRGWVDRGRGGWVGRGRAYPPPEEPEDKKEHSNFDMGPGWIWDEKNSCWKRKWTKDSDSQPTGDVDEREEQPWQDKDDRQHWPPQGMDWERKDQHPPPEGHWETGHRQDWDEREREDTGWDQHHYDSYRDGPKESEEWHDREQSGQYDDWKGDVEGEEQWEENGWVWDDKEQAWRSQREDGSWEWEWEVEEEQPAPAEGRDEQEQQGQAEEDYGDWVWDDGQQAWKRAREDGSWEWEWEYEEDGRQQEPAEQSWKEPRDDRSATGTADGGHWSGDHASVHSPRESSTDRRTQDWGTSSRISEFDDFDEDDEYEREIFQKHHKAKKALAKYQKATRQSQALTEKIEKHRRRLEEIEQKLRKHRHKKERLKRADKTAKPPPPVVEYPEEKFESDPNHPGAYPDEAHYEAEGRYQEFQQQVAEAQAEVRKDYEDHDYKDHDYKDRDYGEHDYKEQDYKEHDYKEHDYEDHDYKDSDYKDREYEDQDYDDREYDRHREDKRSRKRKRLRSHSRRSPSRSSRENSPVTATEGSAIRHYLNQEKGFFDLINDDIIFQAPPPEVAWIRCTHADTFLRRDKETRNKTATARMIELEDKYEHEVVLRAAYVRENQPKYEKPTSIPAVQFQNESDSEYSSGDEIEDSVRAETERELQRKINHPERLHKELWFNEPGEANTGPVCRCCPKARTTGIRHNIYPGDEPYPLCDPASNNVDKLHHYRISVSPVTNFLLKNPTVIEYDSKEYIFEGFSMFSHYRFDANIPPCKVVRFNIEYSLHWIEEDPPENFDVRSIDLFADYLFEEILELYDINLRDDQGGCRKFHFMPRFARLLPDNGKEILSMDQVLTYLLKSSKPLVKESDLPALLDYPLKDWNNFVDTVRGSIAIYPGMRPSSVRIDQLDKNELQKDNLVFPKIIHFGIRPSQVSYVGNSNYNKSWKQYMKFRHLLAYKPKVMMEDKAKLKKMEQHLQQLRLQGTMKREVTVELSCEGFIKTGLNGDLCQHGLMLPVLISHLRFHKSLDHLEKGLGYRFKNRVLLQYALTHPSYRYGTINYGTNPDHARNSMFNCGIRQPQFGNRADWVRVHRKRGMHVLIRIMAQLARKEESVSLIDNYERLEFLGDAVLEFVTTIHLFFMFPNVEEGVLATFRSAIVQNQHFTELARRINLQDYLLYAHGVDLCHESELRRAMADCFEALMGALYIDGGLVLAERIFGEAFFKDEPDLLKVWTDLPLHPLQEDEPEGDRHWIERSPTLQKMVEFEKMTGIEFDHIRLLAKAFTLRNVGYTALTLGHNQRLEFLGDTVLQLVVSDYVFRYFPEHHEGHLSLLRQCLVNSKTQSMVCEDLCLEHFMITTSANSSEAICKFKQKGKADLLEAYLGALYVDKGLEWVKTFTHVCFFPRLKEFIIFGDWNDPKSRLQQCCLLLRNPTDHFPEMPRYKVVDSRGPSNTRVYKVAVYFKNQRLADAEGPSIQTAEMNAAKAAMENRSKLFPFLDYHKHYLYNKFENERQDNRPAQQKKRRRRDEGSEHSVKTESRAASRAESPVVEEKKKEETESKDAATETAEKSKKLQKRKRGGRRGHKSDKVKEQTSK